jgi:hypothetical protein
MDQSIKAGVYGLLLAIIIDLASPVYLDFISSFVASVIVIFIFRLSVLKDGLVAAFLTYIFDQGVMSTIALATSYLANEPYPSFNVDIYTMVTPIVWAVTAVIAGYLGVWLVRRMRPARELPSLPLPTQPPPPPPPP